MSKEITALAPASMKIKIIAPPRAQVLGLDRRLHPLVALHLPADVDLQAGVRRVRPLHRAPQVLLEAARKRSAWRWKEWWERKIRARDQRSAWCHTVASGSAPAAARQWTRARARITRDARNPAILYIQR